MGQILSHPSLSALHRQQEWAWHDGRNFWPVIEDAKSVWNSKPEIFKILHPFWTSGCRRNNCIVQRNGHFPTIYTQETRTFGIRIYKVCDETGYTYDMTVYLARDRQRTAQHLTATHARVSEVTKKIQGRGHKLYMDNYFSSPDLFVDFATKHIYCCGTVRPNRKGMPQDLGPKRMTLQWGDLYVRTRGDLIATLWRDKRDVRILTNMHDVPEEGNSWDNNGKAIKPQIVTVFNRHMGYVHKGDRMANSYSINRRTWKWTKKLFFRVL